MLWSSQGSRGMHMPIGVNACDYQLEQCVQEPLESFGIGNLLGVLPRYYISNGAIACQVACRWCCTHVWSHMHVAGFCSGHRIFDACHFLHLLLPFWVSS